MKKTTISEHSNRLTVDTKELQAMFGCGRETAIKIGLNSNARLKVGRRVLWNVEKIQQYLNQVSDG